MKIILYDINEEMVIEWEEAFKGTDVEVKNESFANMRATYIVTAGNSYGHMSGGIDLAVRNYFGFRIQDAVQWQIIEQFGGKLPVGNYTIVDTHDETKPYLVYAPTMEKPQMIDSTDVFYVACKLFKLANQICNIGDTFAICGLGTSCGGIRPQICAEMMRKAYDHVNGKK